MLVPARLTHGIMLVAADEITHWEKKRSRAVSPPAPIAQGHGGDFFGQGQLWAVCLCWDVGVATRLINQSTRGGRGCVAITRERAVAGSLQTCLRVHHASLSPSPSPRDAPFPSPDCFARVHWPGILAIHHAPESAHHHAHDAVAANRVGLAQRETRSRATFFLIIDPPLSGCLSVLPSATRPLCIPLFFGVSFCYFSGLDWGLAALQRHRLESSPLPRHYA